MANEIRYISRQKVDSFFIAANKSNFIQLFQNSKHASHKSKTGQDANDGKIISFKKLRLPHRQNKNSFVNHTVDQICQTQRTCQKRYRVSQQFTLSNLPKNYVKIISEKNNNSFQCNGKQYLGINNKKLFLKNPATQFKSHTREFKMKTQYYSPKNQNSYISSNFSPKYSSSQNSMPEQRKNNLMSEQIQNLRDQINKNTALLEQIKSLNKQSKQSTQKDTFNLNKNFNSPKANYSLNQASGLQTSRTFKPFTLKNQRYNDQVSSKLQIKADNKDNIQASSFWIFGEQKQWKEQKNKSSTKNKRLNTIMTHEKSETRQNTRSKPKDQQSVSPVPFFRKPNKLQKQLEKQQILQKIKKSDFLYIKKIGQGQFGTVFLAFHRKTSTIFAIKQVTKLRIKSLQMVDQFIIQTKIQTYIDHPNVVRLFGVFDDQQKYCDEGNLFNLLKTKTVFSQDQTKKYVSQIATGIQHLYDNNIFHRDLKPQNIVMTYNTCKICDFGWAAISQERRKTYCGTFDYAAPEIFQGVQYNKSVDLWCLGILTYEMLFGKVPFYHPSRKQTIKRILNVQNQKLKFPLKVSFDAKSFIESLLQKNPQKRLNINEVLKHSFINGY